MQPKANANTDAEVTQLRHFTATARRLLIINLTAQFITLIEAKRYISSISLNVSPDYYFEHILLGWMKFVAPLTPSSVDADPHLKYNKEAAQPLNTIPESVEELLRGMTQVASFDDRLSKAKTFSLWSKAWPTMWIWIQRIYHDHLQMLNHWMDAVVTDIFTRRYVLLETVFIVFVDHDGEPMVAEIIASYPGILNMMADMWIKEGAAKNAVHDCRSGKFSDPRLAIHQKFLAQVLSICGSAGEFVHAICQRIERLLVQARLDYDLLYVEMSPMTWYMSEEEDPWMIRPAIYASSRMTATWMQLWAHIVSAGSSEQYRDEFLFVYVESIAILVECSPQAYDRILDILDHDFLSLFTKSVQLVQSSSTRYGDIIEAAVTALEGIICHATVHRKMLYSMRRRVVANTRENFLPPTSNRKVYDYWSRLIKRLNERLIGYSRYKENSRFVLLCGNSMCGNDSRGGLLRCSACRISLYCSMKCQREHWASHKTLCNSMKGNVHSCVDLSYPDLRYLSYCVASDTEARSKYMTSVLDAHAKLPGSLPFFFLNYVERGPNCALSILLLDANDKTHWFPFPDDDNLRKEWRKLLVVPEGQLPRLLVAIPRGAKDDAQMMTAAMVMPDGQHPIGLRWLHCQYMCAPRIHSGER